MPIPIIQLLVSALAANQQQNNQQQAAAGAAEANNAAGIQNKRTERMVAQNDYTPDSGSMINQRGMSFPGDAMEKQDQVFNMISSKYQNKPPVAAVGGQWGGVGAGGY